MDPPRHCPQGHPQWDPPPLPRAGPPLSPPAPRQNWSRAILRTNHQNTLIYDHLLNEGKPLKLSNLFSTFMAWVEKEFENPVLEFSLASFGWGLLFSVKFRELGIFGVKQLTLTVYHKHFMKYIFWPFFASFEPPPKPNNFAAENFCGVFGPMLPRTLNKFWQAQVRSP